jgi:UDP-N-acetylmuramoyl-tripeptide--D-alanyl-D-alanine ligase
MEFGDPFTGYSALLRTIVFLFVPAFTVMEAVRLRRALHVFQLEGYKRDRFLEWCRRNPVRALFLSGTGDKKPLVMTGRATRLLVVAVLLIPVLVLGLAGAAHLLLGGWPADIITWAVVTGLIFRFTPHLLVATDFVLGPLQKAINERYMGAARTKLAELSPLVVGITGSFGKTSTKFAIERLIGPAGSALATPGSFNTPLGVCRTINENFTAAHRFFIVEMGAYGVGEIAELCRFVKPEIGVLTAIGPAHLDRFGSLADIRRAKYELVKSLPAGGTAVMNTDDPEVRALADRTERVTVVRYGVSAQGRPDVTAEAVGVSASGTSLVVVDRRSGESQAVQTRLLGRHAIGHVLAAVAVATAVGRKVSELGGEIGSLDPVEHRLQLIKGEGGVTVIDDAYNSNPDGGQAALEVLEAMPGARKVVVTPGMVELGEVQADANRRFGAHAGRIADTVIVVAGLNREALVAGVGEGGRAEVMTVGNLAEATARLGKLLRSGDVVLFENDLPDQYEQ